MAPGRQPSGGPRRGPPPRVRELRGPRSPITSTGRARVTIWDRGTYESTEWTDRDVKVTLHGKRVEGRYGLFHTDGDNWMIHRIDPAPPGWEPLPELVRPMLATAGRASRADDDWAYEFKWDGVRAVVYVDGGRIRHLVADRPRRDGLLSRAAGPGRGARIAPGRPRRRDRGPRRQGPAELRGAAAADEHGRAEPGPPARRAASRSPT